MATVKTNSTQVNSKSQEVTNMTTTSTPVRKTVKKVVPVTPETAPVEEELFPDDGICPETIEVREFFKVSYKVSYLYAEKPEWCQQEPEKDSNGNYVVKISKSYISDDYDKAALASMDFRKKGYEVAGVFPINLSVNFLEKVQAAQEAITAIKTTLRDEVLPDDLKDKNLSEYYNRLNYIQNILK